MLVTPPERGGAAGAGNNTLPNHALATEKALPIGRLAALGLQHVLVMYAGAIAVPLVIGRALHLPPAQVAALISADLFCCGIATVIQSLGVTRWFGVRLPVMMGVTFAAVGPMVAIAEAHPGLEGARTIFGATIAAGLLTTLLAPLVGRCRQYFPPVVTGTIITVIGISLMRVGIGWAMGGPPGMAQLDGVNNPRYAAPDNLALAAFVLLAILAIAHYGRGLVANVAVLLGIVLGCGTAAVLGKMSFAKAGEAAWFGLVLPLAFGVPRFEALSILMMTVVMVVVLIESTGMFLALAEITEQPLSPGRLAAGLRTDGLGTLIGGLFKGDLTKGLRRNPIHARIRLRNRDTVFAAREGQRHTRPAKRREIGRKQARQIRFNRIAARRQYQRGRAVALLIAQGEMLCAHRHKARCAIAALGLEQRPQHVWRAHRAHLQRHRQAHGGIA